MPSTRFRLLLTLLLGCACLQAAPPSFDARRDYDTYNCVPGQSGLLTIADVNGDGIPDVVCPNVLLGNGDGTFRVGPTLQAENDYGNLIAIDVNRDGKIDLVFPAYENSLFGVGVMLGRGNGSFQNPVYYLSGINDRTYDDFGVPLVSGDFNGDGILDLAELGKSEIVVLLGTSAGTFNAEPPITLTYTGNESSVSLAAIDMTGDGRLDLVVDAADAIYVLRGNGDGTFQSPLITATESDAGYGDMAVADINQDGFPDVALGDVYSSNILIYPGKGNGRFGLPRTVYLPGGNLAFVVADVNGDGIPDLVNGGVEIALGEGNWKFKAPVYYEVNEDIIGGSPSIGVVDLRNDGRMDILGGTEKVSVLLNVGNGKYEDGVQTLVTGGDIACSAAGDFNGDGIPDLAISNNAEILIYLGTGKSAAPFKAGATYTVTSADCPAAGELNGDGIVDLLVPSGYLNAAGSAIAFLGNGDGTFRQGPSSPVPSIGYFALADFNGDGILDYATTTNQLALGKGDGSFGAPSGYENDNITFFTIEAADLNGDGKGDIVLTDYIGDAIYVLLSSATGFQQTAIHGSGLPGYITLGDLNGDGIIDMAVAEGTGVGIYLNDGSGGFGPAIQMRDPMSDGGGVAVIADVNGDGIADIAFQGDASADIFLGMGAGTFAAPFFLGTGNDSYGLYALNVHGQSPNHGTPDLIEMDGTGVIYTLLNLTK